MNNHSFDHEDSVFYNSIRQEELASIKYGSSNSMHDKLPMGMLEHDIYILHWTRSYRAAKYDCILPLKTEDVRSITPLYVLF